MTETKKCTKCKEHKTLDNFCRDGSRKDGLSYYCRQCAYLRGKEWAALNRSKCVLNTRRWQKKHPEQVKAINDRWKKNNPEKVVASWKRRNELRKQAKNFKLNSAIRQAIWRSITGHKDRLSWCDVVGYDIHELKAHLEQHFLPGMSWDNYGEWHIDHTVPISAHNFETYYDIDFQRCWSLKNLRPMWERDNKSKGSRLYGPFQPALAMGVRV